MLETKAAGSNFAIYPTIKLENLLGSPKFILELISNYASLINCLFSSLSSFLRNLIFPRKIVQNINRKSDLKFKTVQIRLFIQPSTKNFIRNKFVSSEREDDARRILNHATQRAGVMHRRHCKFWKSSKASSAEFIFSAVNLIADAEKSWCGVFGEGDARAICLALRSSAKWKCRNNGINCISLNSCFRFWLRFGGCYQFTAGSSSIRKLRVCALFGNYYRASCDGAGEAGILMLDNLWNIRVCKLKNIFRL